MQQTINVIVEKRQVMIKASMAQRGFKGDQGDTGSQGVQGVQGEQGEQGPQGILPPPQSATITRSGGKISLITKADQTEVNITRDSAGLISQVEDGTYQWGFTRDDGDQISAITVTDL